MGTLARSAWLVLDGLTVPLDDVDGGWICQQLDLGYPDLRTVIDPTPESHGVVDRSMFFGARTVTAQVMTYAGGRMPLDAIVEQFGPFLDIGARPELHYVTEGNDVERVLVLRASAFSAPMGPGTSGSGTAMERPVQFSWVAPFPLPKSAAWKSGTAWAGGQIGTSRTYPLTFPRQYVVGGIGPGVDATLYPGGAVGAKPMVTVYGPISSPVVLFTNQPSGLVSGRLAFLPGFRIDGNHRVEIDTELHTAFLDGDDEQSVLGQMDWVNTLWPVLPIAPTTVNVKLNGTNTTGISQAVVSWQDVYLT